MSRELPIDALVISSDFWYDVYAFSLLGRFSGIRKTFWIVDEFPVEIRYGGKCISWMSSVSFKASLRRLNGQICMTRSVRDFYKSLSERDYPSLIMPMTVESDRFRMSDEPGSKLITYAGNMEIDKDGLQILIEAFRVFWSARKDYKLCLVGDGKDAGIIKNMVRDMHLCDGVVFCGAVHRDAIPGLLAKSSMLCLPRQRSRRAEGGFPTKLGEYLAAGKPVIVTNVGEISTYLTHNVSAYIAEPDNAQSLVDCITYVADHSEEAKKVGLEGRKLADGVFNYKNQAMRLYDFLRTA